MTEGEWRSEKEGTLWKLSYWEARHQDRVTSRPPMPFDLSKSRLSPVFYPIRGSRAHQEVNASRPTYLLLHGKTSRNCADIRSLSLLLSYKPFRYELSNKGILASRGKSKYSTETIFFFETLYHYIFFFVNHRIDEKVTNNTWNRTGFIFLSTKQGREFLSKTIHVGSWKCIIL